MKSRAGNKAPSPQQRTILLGVVAAAFGLGLGYLGPVGWDEQTSSSPSTALARVGFALGSPEASASERAWTRLADDSQIVRRELDPRERAVFDLVVASAGFETRGVPMGARVQEQCKRLGWPRCEGEALRELEKRIRP